MAHRKIENPKFPSEWAINGYFLVQRYIPRVGDECDFYTRQGEKETGLIKFYDGQTIKIRQRYAGTVTFKVMRDPRY